MPIIQSKDGTRTMSISADDWQKMQDMGFHRGWKLLSREDKDEAAVAHTDRRIEVPQAVIDMQKIRRMQQPQADEKTEDKPSDRDIPETLDGLRERLDSLGVKYPVHYKVNGLTKLLNQYYSKL